MTRDRDRDAPHHLDLLGSPAGVRTRRPRRRPLIIAGLTTLTAVCAGTAPSVLAGTQGAPPAPVAAGIHGGSEVSVSASAAVAATAPTGTPVCPSGGSTSPAPNGTGSYAVLIKADINNLQFFAGWSEFGQGWQTQANHIIAHTCGLLQIPSLAVTIAPAGITFDTSHEVFTSGSYLGLGKYNPAFGPGLPGSVAQFHLVPVGPSVTSLYGVRPGGAVDASAATTATAHILSDPKNTGVHFDCPTTTATTLTTGLSYVLPPGRGPNGPVQPGTNLPPWTVQGQPLTGPIQHAHAVVVANNFPVPIFNQDLKDPKNTCNFFAAEFNGFAGGVDTAGNNYFTDFRALPAAHVVQPPGDTWVIGDLQVTEIDPKALPDGPPKNVPGT